MTLPVVQSGPETAAQAQQMAAALTTVVQAAAAVGAFAVGVATLLATRQFHRWTVKQREPDPVLAECKVVKAPNGSRDLHLLLLNPGDAPVTLVGVRFVASILIAQTGKPISQEYIGGSMDYDVALPSSVVNGHCVYVEALPIVMNASLASIRPWETWGWSKTKVVAPRFYRSFSAYGALQGRVSLTYLSGSRRQSADILEARIPFLGNELPDVVDMILEK